MNPTKTTENKMMTSSYQKTHFSILILFIAVLFGCQTSEKPPLTFSGEEPKVQDPLSPEESQKHIEVPNGFEVSLFASEPNIINPIAFTWDERGRLWVLQSMDYPHELANEVGGDRITICEDTNNDGKADKFTEFATEQSLSTGIVKVKDGVIVAQAPDMVFLKDTDGDDKMDDREVLFSGFGTWDTHAGPSNLQYGLDNKIWGAVGYSGFEYTFGDKKVNHTMGVYRFSIDGSFFEPVGRFNNNTWGLGFSEDFEVFGSTANNNHCCYVGIPLSNYDYIDGNRPSWALNADFIQGHYEITAATDIPLQQVDVRGGYTAAAGAQLYTARSFPKEYWNQMFVNEPTGHVVHIAKLVKEGAGFKEEDGGNIFASTDNWTAPVYSSVGPDGALWVADWYNPVIQHNPDARGMDNQIWNDNPGEGNAHLNPLRDKRHGRIYIVSHKNGNKGEITSLDYNDKEELIEGIKSDNMFWRSTAQRLIVENNKTDLIEELKEIVTISQEENSGPSVSALWTLEGLGYFRDETGLDFLKKSLLTKSSSLLKNAIKIIPENAEGTAMLMESGALKHGNPFIRKEAVLKASKLPETVNLVNEISQFAEKTENKNDKWINTAIRIYYRDKESDKIDENEVTMIIPSGAEEEVQWKYTFKKPADSWYESGFDDGNWQSGPALFGGSGSLSSKVKTKWTTSDIWLRRTFEWTGKLEDPVLKITHDEDYELYLNGELLLKEGGWSPNYKYVKLDDRFSSLLKEGENTIAVHCVNTNGGQHIDIGFGKLGEPRADVTLELNTVPQKLAYDKKRLEVMAGDKVRIVLNNKDQMPHNVVVIEMGSLESFGATVDEFLQSPDAKALDYVPQSRYVIGNTKMLDPGETGSIYFTAPSTPGEYPFICTFPGHWRIMQGILVVRPRGRFPSKNPNAVSLLMTGGGGSHNFLEYFGVADGRLLNQGGLADVTYSEDMSEVGKTLDNYDILMLTNNQPVPGNTRERIFERANRGMKLMINHPSTWYNWKDWPEYNKQLVGGGSESHEPLQEFEVEVVKPNHPIMKGVPKTFRIIDELYRWERDTDGIAVEVLAIGRGLETGKEYPVVWVVKHPKTKIVGNTLGHDMDAHGLKHYQTILRNTVMWLK